MIGFSLGNTGQWVGKHLPAPIPNPLPTPLPTATPSVSPAYLASVASAPYATYGPQRMIAAYSGPLFQLRRADGATMDISPQSGGDYPDYAAIDTWAGGSVTTVAALYDQSGGGRHLTQGTAADQPSFDTAQKFGNVVPILFDGFGRTATAANPLVQKTLSRGGLTTLNSVSMSAFMAVQPQTGYNRIGYWMGGAEDAASSVIELQQGLTPNGLTMRVGTSNKTRPLGPMVRYTPNAFGFTNKGDGAYTLFGNDTTGGSGGISTVATPIARMTLGKGLFGAADAYGMFRFFGGAVYSTPLSDADGSAVLTSFKTAFALSPTPEYGLTFIGDSIIEGTGSRLLKNTPHLLASGLTKPRRTYNFAVHGEKLSAAYSQRVARFTDAFTAGVPNVVFVQGGINDIGGGDTGAVAYSGTTTPLVTFLQGLGFKVVVCTLLPTDAHPNWTISALQTERSAYNTAVRGNAAGADAVLDLAANAVMGASSADTSLYGDNLHPTSLGYAWLAGAPSGTYSAANTYYAALQAVLRTTALGASYVP